MRLPRGTQDHWTDHQRGFQNVAGEGFFPSHSTSPTQLQGQSEKPSGRAGQEAAFAPSSRKRRP